MPKRRKNGARRKFIAICQNRRHLAALVSGVGLAPRLYSSWSTRAGASALSPARRAREGWHEYGRPHAKSPTDSRYSGRCPDPWHSDEDDWGPRIPAVTFL